MAFLTPLFLLGAAGIALPVLFHLVRRTTREVTPFSSLMFLQPVPPRLSQRSRLENILLLILRALALLLVALGFARPFLPRVAALSGHGTFKRTVIVLDRSASMRRENLWSAAVARTEQALRAREEQFAVALVAFDRDVQTVADFKQWASAPPGARTTRILPALQALAPTWGGTALGPALLRAAELLEAPAEEEHLEREIVLVSDLQEGSHFEGLQGFEWPKGTTLYVERLVPQSAANAGVQWLAEVGEEEPGAAETKLRFRVSNTAGATGEQFALRWAGEAAAPPTAVYVPAGQTRTARMSPPAGGGTDRLLLTGDETPFDNTLYITPSKPPVRTILYAGEDAATDPQSALYFLQRAFPQTRLQNVRVLTRPVDQPLSPEERMAAQLLVLGDGVAEPVVESARQFAEAGHLVLAPVARVEDAPAVTRLLNLASLPAVEAPVKNYALLAQIDFRHPLFAPLADPRFSDFSKIHFWHYRRLDFSGLSQAVVVARFESGDPAVIEVPLGRGAVIVLASSWRPADSQLALSSKFVPLLQALLERSGGETAVRAQYFVGDELPVPRGEKNHQWQKPDGTRVEAAPGSKFGGTDAPGFYTLNPGELVFPVNLDPAESRTTPLTDVQLAALGLPLAKSAGVPGGDLKAEAQQREAALEESHQKLWRWLLLGAFVFLLAETALAARRERVHTRAPA